MQQSIKSPNLEASIVLRWRLPYSGSKLILLINAPPVPTSPCIQITAPAPSVLPFDQQPSPSPPPPISPLPNLFSPSSRRRNLFLPAQLFSNLRINKSEGGCNQYRCKLSYRQGEKREAIFINCSLAKKIKRSTDFFLPELKFYRLRGGIYVISSGYFVQFYSSW